MPGTGQRLSQYWLDDPNEPGGEHSLLTGHLFKRGEIHVQVRISERALRGVSALACEQPRPPQSSGSRADVASYLC